MNNLRANYERILEVLRKISTDRQLPVQRRRPAMSDLEIISLSLTAEYLGIDSENDLFESFHHVWLLKLSALHIVAIINESLRLLPYLLPGSELDSTMLEKILTQLDDIKKQHEISSKAPDKFNHYFATRGWIAHESMNLDLMLACIELAEKGQVADAEQKLIAYYSSDKMKGLKHQFKGLGK